MIALSTPYHKRKRTNRLLLIVFLFSLFSLSGYGNHSLSAFEKRIQTEVVFKNTATIAKRIIAYKAAFYTIRFNAYTTLILNNTLHLLPHYNQLIKTKLNRFSKQFISLDLSCFMPMKTIPQTSDEVGYFHLIG